MKILRKTIAALLFAAAAGTLLLPWAEHTASAEVEVSPSDPFAALEAVSEEYGFRDPREEFILDRVSEVAYGKIYRFSQVYRGRKVTGRGATLAVNDEGELLSVNSSYFPITGDVRFDYGYRPDGAAEETIFPLDGIPQPAFATERGTGTLYLSAKDGSRLAEIPRAPCAMESVEMENALGEQTRLGVSHSEGGPYLLYDEVRNIYVYNMNGGTLLEWRREYASETGEFGDALAVSAYENAVKAYDFYADESNLGVSIKGLNGANDDLPCNERENGEIPLWLLLHYSHNYQNASYSYDEEREAALLRVGDGSPSGPLYRQAAAADVIAHEYQHGITQFAAGLQYLNESGAIDEAVSDVMAFLIEGREPSEKEFWLIGEHAVPEGSGAIRSAIFPDGDNRLNARRMYPLCRLNHVHQNCDYGGVHYNSTILTHMQFNLWRKLPEFFTRQRIGTLWYSALVSLTPAATFREFARCFLAAAQNLGYPQTALDAIEETLVESGLLEAENTHLVTFRDAYTRTVEEVCVRDGRAAPLPEPPERIPTARYYFVFSGWDADVSHVTEDLVVTARYVSEIRTYTVRYTDGNGETIKEEQTPYGEDSSPPDPPEKSSDALYDYVFEGWSDDYTDIEEDKVIFPRYRPIRCYTVSFYNDDGSHLFDLRVREGENADPAQIPEKESTLEHAYVFTGWEGSLENIFANCAVRATYREEPRVYTATFLSDGKLFCVSKTAYGSPLPLPDLSGKTRTLGERFAGWYLDEACTVSALGHSATGDVVLYAKWEKKGYGCESLLGAGALPLALPCALLLRKKRRSKR